MKSSSSQSTNAGDTLSIGTTDVPTKLAVLASDGNVDNAQTSKESVEAAKYAQDIKNYTAHVAAGAGELLGSEEIGAVAASVIMAGGGAAAIYNHKSRGDVKLNKKQLSGLNEITDPDSGKVTGYSKNGVRVADGGGNLVDIDGEKVQRGKINQIARNIVDKAKLSTNKVRGIFNKTENNTPEESTSKQNPNDHDSTSPDKQQKIHENVLDSDEKIIQSNGERSKTKAQVVSNINDAMDTNKQQFKDGKISSDQFKDKQVELKNLKDKVGSNTISPRDLKNNGVDTPRGLSMTDKGGIDFDKTDANRASAEAQAKQIEEDDYEYYIGTQ